MKDRQINALPLFSTSKIAKKIIVANKEFDNNAFFTTF